MRIIDLTMPFFEGMGIGNCYPQDSPFTIERLAPGLGSARYGICGEAPTRLFLASGENPEFEKQDIYQIVLRDAVIVDIPKGIDEGYTPEEIESGCAKADFRKGDVLIIRSGWGTLERLEEMGDDYQWRTPTYPVPAAKRLVEIMTERQSDILGYDTVSVSDWAVVKRGWEAMGRPKNWSPEAKEFLLKQEEERRKHPPPPEVAVRSAGYLLSAGITLLGGLINLTSIRKERVKLIALPLKIRGARGGPVRVVAIEE